MNDEQNPTVCFECQHEAKRGKREDVVGIGFMNTLAGDVVVPYPILYSRFPTPECLQPTGETCPNGHPYYTMAVAEGQPE